MSELKEYEIYFDVGATQYVKIESETPEEALENADYHASLCFHCSSEGLEIGEGSDFQIYHDGELVLEQDSYNHQSHAIKSLQQELEALKNDADKNRKLINKFLYFAGSDQREFYSRNFDFIFENLENKIKAQGIKEAIANTKEEIWIGDSYSGEICNASDLEQYASELEGGSDE